MAPSSRMAEYRRHVQARRAPVVATVTTPEADAACARCGVRSFADLLRPFADVVGLNVPMRHNAEAPPYALSELSIRFHGVRECRRAAPETAEAYARRAFEPWDGTDDAALARTLDAVPRETREIVAAARARVDKSASATFTPRGFFGDGLELERKRRSCEGEDEANLVSWFGTPWFDRFAGRNARRCAFSDFETADHPRALVFATALPVEPPGRDPGIEDDDGKGSEPSPSGEDASNESTHAVTDAVTASLIETFSRMSAPPRFNPDAYPESIRRGTADPDVAAHFVVLHDAELAGGVVETRLRSVSEALASVMRERRLKGGDGSNERDASFDERIAVTALPILRRETSDASDDALAAFFAASAEARLVGDEAPGDESSSLTLTDDDVETLRAFVRVFATETLLPHMERRLAALNRTVASTRKGLKNQLKTFWGRNVAAAGGLGFAGGFGGSFGSSSANGSGGSVAGNSPNVGFLGDGSSNATASVGTALKEGGGVDASAEEETRYASRSPAFEIRLAADLAFSLRDFETAAHHLRLLQSDFKADKAYRHLACAHESLAEALACQTSASSVGGRGSAGSGLDAAARREIDAAFDAAVAAHRRCAPMASASETSAWTWRVSHSRAVFLASAGAHRDAALALATASGDENLSHHCAASALEAAAFEFLRAAPPAPRKFAMHAVLAGHRFAQAGFRAHAVRCYASALPVYETRLPAVPSRDFSDVAASADEGASFFPDGTRVKTPWARAREHLHFALGRQITKCGGLSAGAAHFEKLLRCADGVSPAAQATYLREFLFVDGARENARRDDSPSEIPEPDATRAFAKKAYGASLPEIDASDVVVSHEPHGRPRDANAVANAASNGSDDSDADDVPEETWRALESDGVVPARLAVAGAGGATWLDAPGAGSRGKKEIGGEQFGVCAAGETVFVETRFRNPLAIPIHLTDVSLRCAFEAPNETKGDEGLETKGSSATLDDDSSYVSTPALAMTLRPLETRLARLKCVPRREGTLRVLGVSWRLRENGETGETKKGDSAANDKEIDSEGTQQRFPNFVPFDVRAARSRRGADGVSWIRDAPRERRLALRVTPAMPRLECRVLNAPASAPAGAVAKITLVARNVATSGGSSTSSGTAEGRGGATAALRARVRAPGEGLVALADVAERDARGDASGAEPTDPGGRGGFVFEPAGWRAVAPGEEVSVDLYVRLPQVGVATLPFVVCYEPPEPAPPSLRFRVARVAAKIVATPSLAVAARVSDAAAHPAAKTLRLAVRNVSGADGSSPGYAFRVRAVRLLAAASVPKTPSSKEARTRDEPKKKNARGDARELEFLSAPRRRFSAPGGVRSVETGSGHVRRKRAPSRPRRRSRDVTGPRVDRRARGGVRDGDARDERVGGGPRPERRRRRRRSVFFGRRVVRRRRRRGGRGGRGGARRRARQTASRVLRGGGGRGRHPAARRFAARNVTRGVSVRGRRRGSRRRGGVGGDRGRRSGRAKKSGDVFRRALFRGARRDETLGHRPSPDPVDDGRTAERRFDDRDAKDDARFKVVTERFCALRAPRAQPFAGRRARHVRVDAIRVESRDELFALRGRRDARLANSRRNRGFRARRRLARRVGRHRQRFEPERDGDRKRTRRDDLVAASRAALALDRAGDPLGGGAERRDGDAGPGRHRVRAGRARDGRVQAHR